MSGAHHNITDKTTTTGIDSGEVISIEENEDTLSNSTTGYIEALTEDYISNQQSDHLVSWSYEVKRNDQKGIEVCVLHNGVEIYRNAIKNIKKKWHSASGFDKVTLSSGSHTFLIVFRQLSGSNKPVKMRRIRFKITNP